MWVFVWLLQGLVASAAGVYLNTPCIRSLLKCAPFQLSVSEGKFSNSFIDDPKTLNRQCRSIGPLLECMQESVLKQCSLNISPAEKEFIKTRLFVAEICKDVEYTQKVYLRNAACINSEREWVIQACNPYDYVQVVNTSNLISLEGSCLFQKLLINCRRDAIQEKCGTDAADLYQRVKAVDMNLDFLCLESRDLRSPKFLLDVVINSYISIMLETLRPVLVMESFYLRDVVTKKEVSNTTPPPPPQKGCSGKECLKLKRAKGPAYFVQDATEYKWRRSGDIPVETSTSEEQNTGSYVEENFPVPSSATTDSVTADTEPGHEESILTNIEAGTDSDLAPEDYSLTSTDDSNEVQSEDSVDEETSSEFLNPTETGPGNVNYEGSRAKVVLGISIPQFEHARVDATQDPDVLDATSTDSGIEADLRNHVAFETATDFEKFQGITTLSPDYLETTVSDVDADRETTPLYPDDHETTDMGTSEGTALHSGDRVSSSADLDSVQETTTSYLDTTTDDLDAIQVTTTVLEPRGDHKSASAESDDFIQETTTLYPSDREAIRTELDNKESTYERDNEKMKANIEEIGVIAKALLSGNNTAKYFLTGNESAKFQNFLKDWFISLGSLGTPPSEKTHKGFDKLIDQLRVEFVSHVRNAYKEISKTTTGSNLEEESSTSDAIDVQPTTGLGESVFEEPISDSDYNIEVASTETSSLENRNERVISDSFQETTTLYPSDGEAVTTDVDTYNKYIFHLKKLRANIDEMVAIWQVLSSENNIEKYFSSGNEGVKFKNFLEDWLKKVISQSKRPDPSEKELINLLEELRVEIVSRARNAYKEITGSTYSSNLEEESFTSDAIDVQPTTTLEESGFEEPTSDSDYNIEVASTETSSLENQNERVISDDRIEGDKEVDYYKIFGRDLDVMWDVVNKVSEIFTPKKIERRTSGFVYPYEDNLADMKLRKADEPGDGRLQIVIAVEALLKELNKVAAEFTSSNFVELPPASNEIDDLKATSEETTLRLKSITVHKDDEKTTEKPVGSLMTIKSIAELGVKLNYIVIGESYIPLEVGHNDERKFNFNVKIPRRKFKFYTSTPTVPSTRIPHDSEYFTTESIPPPEPTTEEPEYQSFSNYELSHEKGIYTDSSCPEVTGNQTPRIPYVANPEKRLELEDCFRASEMKETRIHEESSEELTKPEENPDDDQEFRRLGDRLEHCFRTPEPEMEETRIYEESSEDFAEENPDETDQEFRRSGDIKELPAEKVDTRNLDLETFVALKFYGEILTELALMLPPESPDAKTLAKRASSLVKVISNFSNKKTKPSEKAKMSLEHLGSRRFHKRSSGPESSELDPELDGEKTDGSVRFDVQYTPESNIRVEMKYNKEDGVPQGKYMVLRETTLPLELYFTHRNQNYVHYTEINIPERYMKYDKTILSA